MERSKIIKCLATKFLLFLTTLRTEEETVVTLQRISAELEAEKARSDALLREKLPEKMVTELRECTRAPAGGNIFTV